MSKVVLIVCDALRDDTACEQMGYLEHLVSAHLASRYTVRAELPTMSRPLYETLHTGVPSSRHGITTNRIVRRSEMPNVFELATQNHKVTAASCYCWYSELYNYAPYDPVMHREVDDSALAIQHGRFYMEDSFPDIEVFASGMMLLRKFQPDYLLIHPMGLDYIGEMHGADSGEYRKQAILQDQIMAHILPDVHKAGYTILITGDHGINNDGAHGGTLPDVRHVPLYIIPADGSGAGNTEQIVSQLQIAPTVMRLLGLVIPVTMTQPPL
jgi:predicted AlkP superfamily pyrophosphatase or phosphodiesterase